MPSTASHNDLLNAAFSDESVLRADLPELKRYLLACTEMREVDILNPRVKEGLPKRTEFLKRLIELEEAKLTRIDLRLRSNWTIGISVANLLLLVGKTVYDAVFR